MQRNYEEFSPMNNNNYRGPRSRSRSECYGDYQSFTRWQQESGDLYDGRSHSMSELNQYGKQDQQCSNKDIIEWLCDNVYSNNTRDQQQQVNQLQQLQQPTYLQQGQLLQQRQVQLSQQRQYGEQKHHRQPQRQNDQQQQQHWQQKGNGQGQQWPQQPLRQQEPQQINNINGLDWLSDNDSINNPYQQQTQPHHSQQRSFPEQQMENFYNQQQFPRQQQHEDFPAYYDRNWQDRTQTWSRDSRSRSLDDVRTASYNNVNTIMPQGDWNNSASVQRDTSSPTNSLFLTNDDPSDNLYSSTIRNNFQNAEHGISRTVGYYPKQSVNSHNQGLIVSDPKLSSNTERFYAQQKFQSSISMPNKFGARVFTVTGVEKCLSDTEGTEVFPPNNSVNQKIYDGTSYNTRPKSIHAYPEVPQALDRYSKRHRYIRERVVPNEAPAIPSRPDILRNQGYHKDANVRNVFSGEHSRGTPQFEKSCEAEGDKMFENEPSSGEQQQHQYRQLSKKFIEQQRLLEQQQQLQRQAHSQTKHVGSQPRRQFDTSGMTEYQVSDSILTRNGSLNTNSSRPKHVNTGNVVYPTHLVKSTTQHIPISNDSSASSYNVKVDYNQNYCEIKNGSTESHERRNERFTTVKPMPKSFKTSSKNSPNNRQNLDENVSKFNSQTCSNANPSQFQKFRKSDNEEEEEEEEEEKQLTVAELKKKLFGAQADSAPVSPSFKLPKKPTASHIDTKSSHTTTSTGASSGFLDCNKGKSMLNSSVSNNTKSAADLKSDNYEPVSSGYFIRNKPAPYSKENYKEHNVTTAATLNSFDSSMPSTTSSSELLSGTASTTHLPNIQQNQNSYQTADCTKSSWIYPSNKYRTSAVVQSNDINNDNSPFSTGSLSPKEVYKPAPAVKPASLRGRPVDAPPPPPPPPPRVSSLASEESRRDSKDYSISERLLLADEAISRSKKIESFKRDMGTSEPLQAEHEKFNLTVQEHSKEIECDKFKVFAAREKVRNTSNKEAGFFEASSDKSSSNVDGHSTFVSNLTSRLNAQPETIPSKAAEMALLISGGVNTSEAFQGIDDSDFTWIDDDDVVEEDFYAGNQFQPASFENVQCFIDSDMDDDETCSRASTWSNSTADELRSVGSRRVRFDVHLPRRHGNQTTEEEMINTGDQSIDEVRSGSTVSESTYAPAATISDSTESSKLSAVIPPTSIASETSSTRSESDKSAAPSEAEDHREERDKGPSENIEAKPQKESTNSNSRSIYTLDSGDKFSATPSCLKNSNRSYQLTESDRATGFQILSESKRFDESKSEEASLSSKSIPEIRQCPMADVDEDDLTNLEDVYIDDIVRVNLKETKRSCEEFYSSELQKTSAKGGGGYLEISSRVSTRLDERQEDECHSKCEVSSSKNPASAFDNTLGGDSLKDECLLKESTSSRLKREFLLSSRESTNSFSTAEIKNKDEETFQKSHRSESINSAAKSNSTEYQMASSTRKATDSQSKSDIIKLKNSENRHLLTEKVGSTIHVEDGKTTKSFIENNSSEICESMESKFTASSSGNKYESFQEEIKYKGSNQESIEKKSAAVTMRKKNENIQGETFAEGTTNKSSTDEQQSEEQDHRRWSIRELVSTFEDLSDPFMRTGSFRKQNTNSDK